MTATKQSTELVVKNSSSKSVVVENMVPSAVPMIGHLDDRKKGSQKKLKPAKEELPVLDSILTPSAAR